MVLDHAEKWVGSVKDKADSILGALESARDDPQLLFVDGCPVRFLREVKDDGTEVFIGDIGMFRCPYGELMGPSGVDWEGKAKYEEENNKLPAGDPGIVWSIGGKCMRAYTWMVTEVAKISWLGDITGEG